ncbi:uncharacterized protein LOC123306578 [Coccinella septempunctata]|uniref:uncharacterized protein LOC123306578 n=1 Tax=Coccinella septempunctata TaxID=41139 RepID=UPI001D089958|nr:uncharacterized protein LOC123306578 [Coccinella septempunctata]
MHLQKQAYVFLFWSTVTKYTFRQMQNANSKKILPQTAETTSLRAITKMRHPRYELYNPSNMLLYEKTLIKPINQRLNDLSPKFSQRKVNIQILRELCTNRNENTRPHRKHPLNIIWEIIKTLHK